VQSQALVGIGLTDLMAALRGSDGSPEWGSEGGPKLSRCVDDTPMREGNPLWDLWQRWKANSDPRLFVSFIGGPDGWKQIQWIKPSFIESQRRKFASVPSKFKRLWLNEWAAGDEGSFLSGEERSWVSPSCGFGRHPPRDIPVLRAKVENMVEAARTL
jgi:hypothetical protein